MLLVFERLMHDGQQEAQHNSQLKPPPDVKRCQACPTAAEGLTLGTPQPLPLHTVSIPLHPNNFLGKTRLFRIWSSAPVSCLQRQQPLFDDRWMVDSGRR